MVSVQSALVENTPEPFPSREMGRVPRVGEYEPPSHGGAFLTEIVDDLASLLVHGSPPAGLKLLPLEDTPLEAARIITDALCRRDAPVRCARVCPELGDAEPRAAILDGGPRGRVVALMLGTALGLRTPMEIRRTLRTVRRALIRQDALVITGATPRTAALAAPRALDVEHLVSMGAAAGFQLVGQWWSAPEEATAIALLSAD